MTSAIHLIRRKGNNSSIHIISYVQVIEDPHIAFKWDTFTASSFIDSLSSFV